MSTLGSDADLQEIEDELLFRQALLESLDDDPANEAVRREHESVIKKLEERIEGATRSGPLAQESDTSRSYKAPGAYPQTDDDDDDDETMSQDLPHLDAQSAFASPSTGQKRRRDGSASAEMERHKRGPLTAMAPPAQKAARQDRRTAIERQRQYEAALARKRQSEMADAAIASRLSQQPASSPIAGPSRTPMSPSQMAPVFRPRGHNFTPASQAQSPVPAPYSAPPNNLPRVYSSPGYGLPAAPVKAETAQHSSPPRSAVPAFIDLTGSDDDEPAHPSQVQKMKDEATQELRRRQLWEQRSMDPQHRLALSQRQNAEMQRRRHDELMRQQQIAKQEMANALMQARRGQDSRSMQQFHLTNSRLDRENFARMQAWQRSVAASNPHSPMPHPHQHLPYGPYIPSSPAVPSQHDLQQLDGLFNRHGRNPSFEVIESDDSDDLHYLRSHPIYRDTAPMEIYDSENTKEELRKLMENIQPDDASKIANEDDVPIEGLTIKLKPYQHAGLEWLQKMEDGSNKGGILADDMGLGKTVQAISLLVTRRSEDPVNKTTLILAPVALLRQWEQEIMTKVKPGRHRLHTFVHHAGTKKKSHKDLREYDVVLTTFGTIAAELKRIERFELRKKTDAQATPRDDEKCLFLGPDCKWYRIIVDEAQCIKNRTTKTARAAFCIHARSRFCMTGTPMMNSVEELYSLIHFLRIKPYNNWNKFRSEFNQPLRGNADGPRQMAMHKLQALLKAILLRRNKQTKINGRPILNLPERRVEETNPEFSKDERELYTSLETHSAAKFNRFLKAGTVSKSYAQILVLLLRLRQACCHPHLIKDLGVVAATAEISQETMDDICRNLDPNVVARVKEANGTFECPVCYDAVENPAIFTPCGHDTCPECFTRIADPSNAVAQGDEQGRIARCPECRGEINVKKVIDYECFKRIHLPELTAAEESVKAEEDIEALAEEEDDDESDTSDEDDDEDESDTSSLDGFIVNDEIEDDTADNDEDAAERKQKAALKKSQKKAKRKLSKKAKGKMKETSKSGRKKQAATMTLPELKKLAMRNVSWRKIYLRRLREDFQMSAKIERTMEILESIVSGPEGEKTIIFSQWTSLLDLLEVPVSEKNWGYRRYDGSMNAKLRADAVDDFKNRPNVRMMLVSLKAGNAGLNLNCASQVIIMDPFWNPYIEEQAIDRAHRLGQTRPVLVHRVLIQETVEDRIIALQEKKRQLISQALDEKASQSLGRLSVQELSYLFGINRSVDGPAPVGQMPAQGVAGGLGA